MPRHSKDTIAILGIDIGKNTFHLVGLNKRGAIVLRQKLSRRQLDARLAGFQHADDRASEVCGQADGAS